jgi:YHS domain-containing protein
MQEKDSTDALPCSISPKTVCGREMTAEISWYPQALYQNRIIYFCTEICLDAFKADPDRFITAHKEKEVSRSE